MKKLIICFISVILCLSLFGCATSTDATSDSAETVSREPSFVVVEQADYWIIVYHKDTKVMYVVSNCRYNRGTFTLLEHPDGTPMVWEG